MYRILNFLVIVSVINADVLPKSVLLNDGRRIPIISYGTLGKTQDLDLIKPAVIQAIESGYRQIDTAAAYENEEQVGEAIADVISRGIVTREELWITTKLNLEVGTREGVLPALQASLKKLKLDYVDLYLIHSPENLVLVQEYDYLNVWKGVEDVRRLNLTRSIGVSNFNITDINRVLANSEMVPSVNEVEVNPTYTNSEIIAHCQSLNITILSYAPFGFMVPRPIDYNVTSTFKDPVLVRIAQKYGKTTSQVVLRYLIDRKTIPIPRSTNTERIKLNIDLFDFRLSQEDISSINELNKDVKVYNFDQEALAILFDYYGL
ncbi:aldo-keto reductase AKR2E4-like [Vanessa cardui]|uniref:aldo-keto reductase AKR2E4-like n=1 Tax=Vanessa cardui TaxID=171605 RepID=UPI001F13D4E3|nr:aldo-keto reductase AKR2E4-like [Vanessa cardui]